MKQHYEKAKKRLKESGNRTKVAIVGFAPGWQQAPFKDESFEIWTLNEAYKMLPQVEGAGADRWFEIHSRQSPSKNKEEHINFLKQCPVPLYMWDHYDDMPNSIKFPKDEIVSLFGTSYFTNSISWMIAMAIYEGFETIHVYGVDMAQNDEYCVGPDTRILTADLKWVKASEVKVGTELLAFDENPVRNGYNRNWQIAKVQSAAEIVRPSYKLTMQDGSELMCSQEHRWLCVGGDRLRWRETQDITAKGHYADGRSGSICKPLEVWEEDRTYEGGYIAAAFDGEGSICQTAAKETTSILKLAFAQRDNAMARKVTEILESKGFKFNQSHVDSDCKTYDVKGGRQAIIKFMGMFRPPRLLERLDMTKLGAMRTTNAIHVDKKEFIGDQKVIALKTETGTFIAEGFASHNSYQKPSVEYFLGIAQGLGAEVFIPATSDLLKTALMYGFESDNAMRLKMKSRQKELKDKKAQLEQQMAQSNAVVTQCRDAIHQINGALDDIAYWLKNWQI